MFEYHVRAAALPQATCCFKTEYHGFALADRKRTWSLQLLLIEETGRPLGSFRPDIVYARALCDPVVFWPPKRSNKGSRQRRRRPAPEALGDDEHSTDTEDRDDDPDSGAEDDPHDNVEDAWLDEISDLLEEVTDNDILCPDGFSDAPAEEAPDSEQDEEGSGIEAESGDPGETAAEEELVGPFGPDPEKHMDPIGEDREAGGTIPDLGSPTVVEVAPPAGAATVSSASSSSAARIIRESAEISCEVPGGRITYYKSKDSYQAVCSNPAHSNCVMTKTCRASAALARYGQGRPLGFLAAWLNNNQQPTKFNHWQVAPNFQDRKLHRLQLAATDGGRLLLAKERQQREDSDIEPHDVP